MPNRFAFCRRHAWRLACAGMLCAALWFPVIAAAAQHAAPKPATLVDGLGHLHHPVSTQNALAQRFFDQGLTFVYAFNHQEAVRSFRRVAELDPQLAMAHWGIALALGPNYNARMDEAQPEEARHALQRAADLAAGNPSTTEAERSYIAALTLRFAETSDLASTAAADNYRDAMRELMRHNPDDPDAAALFADSVMTPHAWRLWNADGTPAEGTSEIIGVLESVLAKNPDHIGANHFYIHAVEASPNPERGLPSADRLMVLAPAAGHLLHMPAHIYDRVGLHAAAARANAAAVAADRAYLNKLVGSNPYAGYFNHNLHFLAIAKTNAGRYRDAIRAAKAFAHRVGSNAPGIPRLEEYLPAVALIDVRFGKWDEISRLPAPPKSYAGLRAVWHFARGMARAAKGQPDAAQRERDAMTKTLAAISAEERWGNNAAADIFAIASALLDGNIALSRGDGTEAIERFQAAARVDDALAFDEPAPWYIPPREALARAMLEAGDAAGAENVLREELARRPKGGRALFALIKAMQQQAKPTVALEQEFAVAWKDADVSPWVGYAAPSVAARRQRRASSIAR